VEEELGKREGRQKRSKVEETWRLTWETRRIHGRSGPDMEKVFIGREKVKKTGGCLDTSCDGSFNIDRKNIRWMNSSEIREAV
jgi:hypothetical protein